jgi:hypothetical protein
MNEVDDLPISNSQCATCFEYLEAWKLTEVAQLIGFSLSGDGSFLDIESESEFDYYWFRFMERLWFAAEFLDNIFAGVAFAVGYVIKSIRKRNSTKKSIGHMFNRSLAYLFCFEPEKFNYSMASLMKFFNLENPASDNHHTCYDLILVWKNVSIKFRLILQIEE